MSFTDGKPWTVTEEDLHRPWSGRIDGEYFRCFSCGHKFEVGDTIRWQFTNDTLGAGGNPFVCQSCDGTKEDIVNKIKRMKEEVKKYWWFIKRERT